jgi:hypothetical protein
MKSKVLISDPGHPVILSTLLSFSAFSASTAVNPLLVSSLICVFATLA